MITVSATDAMMARMKAQWISRPSVFRYALVKSRSRSTSCPERVLASSALALPPSHRCVVIVRACVRHHFARIIVGPERGRLRIRAECELQHAHAREAELMAQRLHLRRDHAQVFGDDGKLAQSAFQRFEKLRARTLGPAAVDRGGFSRRHFPKSFKASEVIQPHHVHHPECRAQPFDPPFVSGGLHAIPAVDRIPPKLAVRAEVIGRNTGHLGGPAIGIQLEQIAVRPYVGAIVRHVDWNVAHHLNAARVTIILQFIPLAMELPLPEFLDLDFLRVRLGDGPCGPGLLAVGLFERHEAGEIVQPAALTLTEILELGRGMEVAERIPQ